MRWLWRLSLRARLLVIGVTGLVITLAISGLAFYGALTFVINRTIDQSASASAADVATMVDEDRLPAVIPTSGAQVVQVVDAQQRVVAGSATADKITPLLDPDELARALTGEPVIITGSRLGTNGTLRVRAVAAGPASAPVSVIVAWAYSDVEAARQALRAALLITLPVLVVGLAAIAWRVIGWTLRPVEQLRSGADQISRSVAADLDERLPVPQAADEIRALAVTLNAMLDRLGQARLRQRAFVADAAHELRSPLASMQAQLEVAEHLGEGGSLPADLLVDLHRLSGLVEDLLLLARSDGADKASTAVEEFDVADLLIEVAGAYAGARVPVSVRSGPAPKVVADRGELRRAVDNLVANAVRHAGSSVELSAAVQDAEVTLAVADDGPGIEVADRDRVFERFTRLDDARARDSGGSGLGLPITRELIGRAGGSVRFVDAAPPWVLQAVITLPLPTADVAG